MSVVYMGESVQTAWVTHMCEGTFDVEAYIWMEVYSWGQKFTTITKHQQKKTQLWIIQVRTQYYK